MESDTVLGPVLEVAGGEIRTGTCSWTDPTLVKGSDWYPRRSMSAAERLAFYASRFAVVEADSTYYWPPSPQLAADWVERTPQGFVMDLKAYGLLTGHPTRRDSLWEDLRSSVAEVHRDKKNVYAEHLPADALDEAWSRFEHALAPLHEAGKLGAVLLQYPPWFTPTKVNRVELERIRDRLPRYPVAVELRSPQWWADQHDRRRTLDLLRSHDLAHVVVDAPAASGLPQVPEATAELAVIRFHGRNEDTWDKRNISAAERFDYLYDDSELREWVPQVVDLAGRTRSLHALMNNCYGDKGVTNAGDLTRLLLEAGARRATPGSRPSPP